MGQPWTKAGLISAIESASDDACVYIEINGDGILRHQIAVDFDDDGIVLSVIAETPEGIEGVE